MATMAFIGETQSGKTTLIRHMMWLENSENRIPTRTPSTRLLTRVPLFGYTVVDTPPLSPNLVESNIRLFDSVKLWCVVHDSSNPDTSAVDKWIEALEHAGVNTQHVVLLLTTKSDNYNIPQVNDDTSLLTTLYQITGVQDHVLVSLHTVCDVYTVLYDKLTEILSSHQ